MRIYPDELKRIGVPLLSPAIDDCRLPQELPKHPVWITARDLPFTSERVTLDR